MPALGRTLTIRVSMCVVVVVHCQALRRVVVHIDSKPSARFMATVSDSQWPSVPRLTNLNTAIEGPMSSERMLVLFEAFRT